MAYVEYEADGKTIKARVQQKTDTLANWMANDMVLKAGEQAFVINDDGTPLNFKIGDGTKIFSDLPNWIDFSNAQRVSSVAPGVLPAGPAEETKYMEVTAMGTYTYGGNTLAEITEDGYKATFWWTGTEWISNGVVKVKGDMPTGTDVLEEEDIPKGKAVIDYVEPIKNKADYVAQQEEKFESKGSTTYLYDISQLTGVITGYGLNIGKPTEFSSVRLPFVMYSQAGFPITQLKCVVRIGSYTGTIIRQSYADFDKDLNEAGEVVFEFDEYINTSLDDIWVEIHSNGRMVRYNASGGTGLRYTTSTNIETNFSTTSGVIEDNIGYYIEIGYTYQGYAPSDNFADDLNDKLPLKDGVNVVEEGQMKPASSDAVYRVVSPIIDKVDSIVEEESDIDPDNSVDTGYSGVISYEVGTFTGWGQIVGKPAEFDTLRVPKIKYSQAGFPITEIAYLIRKGAFNGTIIAESKIPFSASLNEEKEVMIPIGSKYVNSDNSDIWVEIRTNGRLPRYNSVNYSESRFSTSTNIDTKFSSASSLVGDGIGYYMQLGMAKDVINPTDSFIDKIKDGIDIQANFQGELGKKYVVAACNIRLPLTLGGAPALHNDAGHEPCNIAWVAKQDGDIRVGMSFTATKVITMSATPHTSLRLAGYEVSTTGGISIHAISLFKDGVKVPIDEINLPGTSIWFYALMMVE